MVKVYVEHIGTVSVELKVERPFCETRTVNLYEDDCLHIEEGPRVLSLGVGGLDVSEDVKRLSQELLSRNLAATDSVIEQAYRTYSASFSATWLAFTDPKNVIDGLLSGGYLE